METNQPLADLIGRIYNAGLGIDSWDSVLDNIMPAVGAEASALFVEDRSHAPMGFDLYSLRGYPGHVPHTYSSYFADRDVRLPAIMALQPGQTYIDDQTMPFQDVEQSEIYTDFYRPLGLGHGIGVVPFNEGGRFAILSAHRAIRAGNFRPEDVAAFQVLSPHITRALQLQRQIARTRLIANGLTVALDHFRLAVVLAGPQGELIECNQAAEALLRRPESPLRLSAGRISAASSVNAPALARAIAQAASALHPSISPPPPPLRLCKTDGSGEIGIMVVPVRRTEMLGVATGPIVLVFLSDPGQVPRTDPDLLVSQFGLSPAEAQVAAALAACENIGEIADTRRVSQETVRVQVKRILAKTETRTQAQLIGLLSRSLAALRRSPE